MTSRKVSRLVLPLQYIQASSPSNARLLSLQGTSFALLTDPLLEHINLCKKLLFDGVTSGLIHEGVVTPEAIFFDVDATVIEEESLVEIAKMAGKQGEIEELTTKAMAGKMDFSESLRRRVQILAGTKRNIIHAVKPTFNPGIKSLAEFCVSRQIKLFLVSGGFVDLAQGVAKSLGFHDFHANQFEWSGDQLTGRVLGEIVDARGKVQAIERWCQHYNLDPKRCIAVGDGANDLPMMEFVGCAVGFKPKKVLWSSLAVCNAIGDHTLLKELLDSSLCSG